MDGMNQFDAWLALSKDRTSRHLRAIKITQVTRETQGRQSVRQTWLAQRAGRFLRGVGGKLVTVGKQLECGCDSCVLTGHAAGAA